MLAEIKDSALTMVQDPGTAQVGMTATVTVADPPTAQPAFSYTFVYDGVYTARSVWITNEFADFTVTLQPQNVPAGFAMTFLPVDPDADGSVPSGPITWLTPGTKQSIPKPDYVIVGPELKDAMKLTFTVRNDATVDKDSLVSFALNVLLTGQGASTTFTSPDPTIINVDPPN